MLKKLLFSILITNQLQASSPRDRYFYTSIPIYAIIKCIKSSYKEMASKDLKLNPLLKTKPLHIYYHKSGLLRVSYTDEHKRITYSRTCHIKITEGNIVDFEYDELVRECNYKLNRSLDHTEQQIDAIIKWQIKLLIDGNKIQNFFTK